jgi:hypothetical protein
LLWLVHGTATHGEKECNNYDLTDVLCFDWPIIMIGASGLLFILPYLFAVPVSLLWVGLQENK